MIVRTAISESSRSLWNVPSAARSAGITWLSSHAPFTYRKKSSCGRMVGEREEASMPEALVMGQP